MSLLAGRWQRTTEVCCEQREARGERLVFGPSQPAATCAAGDPLVERLGRTQAVLYQDSRAVGRLVRPRVDLEDAPCAAPLQLVSLVFDFWQPATRSGPGRVEHLRLPLEAVQASSFSLSVYADGEPLPGQHTFCGRTAAAAVSLHQQRIAYIRQAQKKFSEAVANSPNRHLLARSDAEFTVESGSEWDSVSLTFNTADAAWLQRIVLKLLVLPKAPVDDCGGSVGKTCAETKLTRAGADTAVAMASASAQAVPQAHSGQQQGQGRPKEQQQAEQAEEQQQHEARPLGSEGGPEAAAEGAVHGGGEQPAAPPPPPPPAAAALQGALAAGAREERPNDVPPDSAAASGDSRGADSSTSSEHGHSHGNSCRGPMTGGGSGSGGKSSSGGGNSGAGRDAAPRDSAQVSSGKAARKRRDAREGGAEEADAATRSSTPVAPAPSDVLPTPAHVSHPALHFASSVSSKPEVTAAPEAACEQHAGGEAVAEAKPTVKLIPRAEAAGAAALLGDRRAPADAPSCESACCLGGANACEDGAAGAPQAGARAAKAGSGDVAQAGEARGAASAAESSLQPDSSATGPAAPPESPRSVASAAPGLVPPPPVPPHLPYVNGSWQSHSKATAGGHELHAQLQHVASAYAHPGPPGLSHGPHLNSSHGAGSHGANGKTRNGETTEAALLATYLKALAAQQHAATAGSGGALPQPQGQHPAQANGFDAALQQQLLLAQHNCVQSLSAGQQAPPGLQAWQVPSHQQLAGAQLGLPAAAHTHQPQQHQQHQQQPAQQQQQQQQLVQHALQQHILQQHLLQQMVQQQHLQQQQQQQLHGLAHAYLQQQQQHPQPEPHKLGVPTTVGSGAGELGAVPSAERAAQPHTLAVPAAAEPGVDTASPFTVPFAAAPAPILAPQPVLAPTPMVAADGSGLASWDAVSTSSTHSEPSTAVSAPPLERRAGHPHRVQSHGNMLAAVQGSGGGGGGGNGGGARDAGGRQAAGFRNRTSFSGQGGPALGGASAGATPSVAGSGGGTGGGGSLPGGVPGAGGPLNGRACGGGGGGGGGAAQQRHASGPHSFVRGAGRHEAGASVSADNSRPSSRGPMPHGAAGLHPRHAGGASASDPHPPPPETLPLPDPKGLCDLDRFISQTEPFIAIDPDKPPQQAMHELRLRDLWNFYFEPSVYGREVFTLGGHRGASNSYFVPYLSAIQIFTRALPTDVGGTNRLYVSEDSQGWPKHMHLKFEYFEQELPFNRLPLYDQIELLSGRPIAASTTTGPGVHAPGSAAAAARASASAAAAAAAAAAAGAAAPGAAALAGAGAGAGGGAAAVTANGRSGASSTSGSETGEEDACATAHLAVACAASAEPVTPAAAGSAAAAAAAAGGDRKSADGAAADDAPGSAGTGSPAASPDAARSNATDAASPPSTASSSPGDADATGGAAAAAAAAAAGGGSSAGSPGSAASAASSGAGSGSGPGSRLLYDMRLMDVHPASWFAVAWYPVYRIPDAPLYARFLTFHSFGPLVESMRNVQERLARGQVAPYSILSLPVVGLSWYNMQGERWMEPLDESAVMGAHGHPAAAPGGGGPGGVASPRGPPARPPGGRHGGTDVWYQGFLHQMQATADRLARGGGLRVLGQHGAEEVRLRVPDYEFFRARS